MHKKTMAALAAAVATTTLSQGQPQGVILSVGPHSLGYGVQVVNGVSTGALPLPTNSAVGSPVVGNFNIGDGLNLVSRVRHLKTANWFYRVAGDNRERTPANLSVTSLSNDRVEFRFQAVGAGGVIVPGLFGLMDVSLFDQGPNAAVCSWNLCFVNTTEDQIYTVDSFFALDADLNGTPMGDVSSPIDASAGRLLRFQEGGTTGMLYSPRAIGSGQGPTSSTSAAMLNGTISDFNPDLNPFGTNGSADNAWLVQHTCNVAPGGQECQPIYFGIGVNGAVPNVVPEPATLAVLGLGCISMLRKKSRRT